VGTVAGSSLPTARRFLDASGQAAVVSIGHGIPEIGRAMAEQSSQIAFAHTSQFHTAPAEKLAERLLALAPPNFRNGGRVYFTSGGSEATETAIKLAPAVSPRKRPERSLPAFSPAARAITAALSAAMSVSGNVARRAPYEPLIAEWGHTSLRVSAIAALSKKLFPNANWFARTIFTSIYSNTNPGKPQAFIFEPVVGATLGAAVPPEGYRRAAWRKSAARTGILLIADEVMTGMGPYRKTFCCAALEHRAGHDSGGKRSRQRDTRRSARFSFPRASSRHSNAAQAPSFTASLTRLIRSPPPRATPFSTISKRTSCLIA